MHDHDMTARKRFADVPLDADTCIIQQKPIRVGEYDALMQAWNWDGISAVSLIFVSTDVEELSDEELTALARLSALPEAGTSFTLSRGMQGYTFVNFNFSL